VARSPFPRTSTVGFPPWWQSALKTWEIWVAVPQVIWHRTWRMASAGPFPSADDRREFGRMGQEKAAALSESLGAMTAQMLRANQEAARFMLNQWWTAWMSPWAFIASSPAHWFGFPSAITRHPAGVRRVGTSLARVVDKGLAPVHRRATSNARRLRRRKV
jgi:hypothetical protein